MSAFRFPVLAAFVCILFASFLNACTVSPEQTAQLQKMQQQVAALEEFKKQSKSSVESVYFDMDNLTERVRVLESNAKSATTAAADIEPLLKKIADLEQRLTAMSAQPVAVSAAASPAGKPAPKQAADSAGAKASGANAGKSVASAAKRAERKETVSRTVPKGFYYKVRTGETLQAVASKHRVTSAQICRANRIPMSALLYAGQQIFIPRS